MQNLSIGVVGCGAWGKNLIRNFSELGVLGAVADENMDLARDFAIQYEVQALTPETLLSDPSINGVVIVSWAPYHFVQARQALLNNKHVFVEKPLAMTSQEARELTSLAAQHNRVLMAGHIVQYHPAFMKLKALVNEGVVGPVRHITATRLALGRFRYHENAFWDLAPHDLSMILSLTPGSVQDVKAFGHSAYSPGIHSSVTSLLTFEGGVTAEVKCSWATPIKEQRLVVVGDRGMLVFEDTKPWDQKLALYRNPIVGDPQPVAQMVNPEYIDLLEGEPLKEECRHFLGAVQGHHDPITDGHESIAIIDILEKVDGCLAGTQSFKKTA